MIYLGCLGSRSGRDGAWCGHRFEMLAPPRRTSYMVPFMKPEGTGLRNYSSPSRPRSYKVMPNAVNSGTRKCSLLAKSVQDCSDLTFAKWHFQVLGYLFCADRLADLMNGVVASELKRFCLLLDHAFTWHGTIEAQSCG